MAAATRVNRKREREGGSIAVKLDSTNNERRKDYKR